MSKQDKLVIRYHTMADDLREEYHTFKEGMDRFKALAQNVLGAGYVLIPNRDTHREYTRQEGKKLQEYKGAGFYKGKDEYYAYPTKVEQIDNLLNNTIGKNGNYVTISVLKIN